MAWKDFIPGLETAKDRQNEVEVLEHCAKVTGLRCVQCIRFNRYDAEVYKDDRLVAIAEIKCRDNIKHDRFGDFILREEKWRACKKIAKELNVKFLAIFRYSDGIFYIDETDTSIGQDGRNIGSFVPKNSRTGLAESNVFFPIRLLKEIK